MSSGSGVEVRDAQVRALSQWRVVVSEKIRFVDVGKLVGKAQSPLRAVQQARAVLVIVDQLRGHVHAAAALVAAGTQHVGRAGADRWRVEVGRIKNRVVDVLGEDIAA